MKYTSRQNFSSRPPSEILFEILDLKRRREKGEPIENPLITLMLNNRNTVCGFLIDFKMDEPQSSHLMMELAGSSDIFFTKTSAVEGLIVHAIEKIDYLLFDIGKEQIVAKDQVTRHQVKTRISVEGKRLSLFFDKPMGLKVPQHIIENYEGFFLKNLITDIVAVLREIGENEEEKGKIQDAIDEVILERGEWLEIYIEAGELFISDTLTRSYSTSIQRHFLKEAIANTLKSI